jgi:hypothetical protein
MRGRYAGASHEVRESNRETRDDGTTGRGDPAERYGPPFDLAARGVVSDEGRAGNRRSVHERGATVPDEGPHDRALLPQDLSEEQLAVAPLLASVDALVIGGLTQGEDDRFVAVLPS